MMVELGEFASEVLSAYAITFLLLLGLGAWTWRQAHLAKQALKHAEEMFGTKD